MSEEISSEFVAFEIIMGMHPDKRDRNYQDIELEWMRNINTMQELENALHAKSNQYNIYFYAFLCAGGFANPVFQFEDELHQPIVYINHLKSINHY